MTIKESNKLIVEFMGYKLDEDKRWEIPDHPFTDPGGYGLFSQRIDYSSISMGYSTSWDWLMPVVDKIESLNYDVSIGSGCFCRIIDIDFDRIGFNEIETSYPTKIESVYKAVLEFLEQYNEINK